MRFRSILTGASAVAIALAAQSASQTAMAQDTSDAMPGSAFDFVSMMLNFAPEGLISYESLDRVGDEGFVMLGVAMTPPDEDEPVLINRVEVDRIDWVALMSDEQPAFATARITGVDIPSALFEEEFADIGYDFGDRVAADFGIDYDLNGDTIDLRDFSISIADVIALTLALNADGIPGPEALNNPMMAATTSQLTEFSLRLEDLGGLPEIITTTAEEFGMSSDDALAMIRAQAPMAQMMLQGERGSLIAATLMSIVEDLPNLSGPVTLSLSPDQPLNAMSFLAAGEQDPEAIITQMGVGLDY